MPDSWVINASPIILLAKAGLIGHVSELANPLVIPQPVEREIIGGGKEDAAVHWIKTDGRQFIRPSTIEIPELKDSQIGAGERSVISWAVANLNFIAILDDSEARAIARKLGVKVLGTIGVVLRLKKAGFIPEVKSSLLKIRGAGAFMSDGLFREALQLAGEKL